MKYLRLHHAKTGDSLFLSGFGLELSHDELASSYVKVGYRVLSAGFFHFDASGQPVVHGYSHSLQIGPAVDDAEFIARLNEVQRRTYEATYGHIRAA